MKKDTQKPHRRLVSILTRSFSILSLTALIVLGSVQLFFNIRTQQVAIENNQQLIAQEAAKTVSNFITEKISVLRAAIWLTTPSFNTEGRQKEFLQSLLGLYPSFLQARQFDSQNKLSMRVSRRSFIASEHAGVMYIDNALDTVQHQDYYISPVYIDKITNEPLILLAVPVTDLTGVFRGTLMAEMNLKFMWDLLGHIKHGTAGYAYVVDKDGNLISCNDESRVLKNENVRHIDPVRDFMKNGNTARQVNVYTFRGLNQSLVVGSYVPLGTPDWAIVIELPWMEAYKDIIREIIIGIGTIILLAFLIGNLSVRLSKQISIPIVGLMETATKIAQGERKQLAEVRGPLEVQSLARAFNSMTAQLNKSYQQLEEKTVELDLYFTRSLDLLCIADMNGKFRRLNKEWETTLGYGIDELLNKDVLSLVHPEDVPETQEKLSELGKQQEVLNFVNRYRCKDGSYRWIEWRSTPVDDRIYAVARDITERKKAEETLQLLAHTMESISEIATVTDLDDRLTFVNDAFLNTYGYERGEVIGQHISLVWSPNNKTGLIEEILQQSKIGSWKGEILNLTKDGREFPLSLHTSQVHDKEGNIIGLVGISEDISEIKKLEAQLIQSQKMEAIGRLAGGIAHDFNNMIGIILGYASLMKLDVNDTDPSKENIIAIISAAERSANLTKQLLAFARKQVIAPLVLNLNDTIKILSRMLTRLIGEDITLTLRLAEDLWNVKIDPSQVDQMLTNLATNARDAIDNVGKIFLETSNTVIGKEYAQEHVEVIPGEYVQIAFSDDGKGMEKEILNSIFEPFFTTKPKGQGTGLGLATVFGIVKQNNGFISVYSEPHHGTTFKILLPRVYGEAEKMVEQTTDELREGSETILIVEDEKKLLDLAGKTLEKYGYTVFTAMSPRDAIQTFEQYHQQIHLLITDVVMPGMNGKELYDHLVKIRPGLRVIYMSGYTADVITERGILNEGMQFIKKPFTPTDLVANVQKALKNSV